MEPLVSSSRGDLVSRKEFRVAIDSAFLLNYLILFCSQMASMGWSEDILLAVTGLESHQ
jgi:hypothetical protein